MLGAGGKTESREECGVGSPGNDPDACYLPLETLEELLGYEELNERESPKCTRLVRTEPLNKSFSEIKLQVNGRRYKRSGCPRTLVCHDYKGGYVDDRFVHGSKNPVNYTYSHWLQTDIFCYFSHRFVTIPPLGWINAAHRHGVQCIGTIITECEDGKATCEKLLSSRENMTRAVQSLVTVAKHYGFDGYLVNIENELEKPTEMLEFLRLLTQEMKKVDPDSLVIWYDAVTIEGKLKWQDELNELNKPFFDVCDGIYLNYGWNDEKLHRSVEEAEDREYDVYVGVDVFGRGCFGGGGLDTFRAIEKVFGQRLSAAIFAPGWSFECHPYEDFPLVDGSLWGKCANFLYFRMLVKPAGEEHVCHTEISPSTYTIFLTTDFNIGYGDTYFFLGQELADKVQQPWYNMNEQTFVPILNTFRQSDCNPYDYRGWFDTTKGFFGGGCVKITGSAMTPNNLLLFDPACPIWIPTNIPLTSVPALPVQESSEDSQSKSALIALLAWKPESNGLPYTDSSSHPIKLVVELMKPTISTRKIIRLSNTCDQIVFEAPETPIAIQLKDFIPKKYAEDPNLPPLPELNFVFKDVPFVETEINDWRISCLLVDVNHCLDWNITSVKLGTLQNAYVGMLSLGMLSY